MGIVVKLLDFILFPFFLVIALAAPLFDAQACLPPSYFPDFLVDLKKWYISEYGDYLVGEKPHFFAGLVWFELLFQWPLVLLNLYGILAGMPWFKTTCLICGASFSTSMAAVLSELMNSQRASDKLLMMYVPFMVFGVLATLRGLLPHSTKAFSSTGKRPLLPRKKRA